MNADDELAESLTQMLEEVVVETSERLFSRVMRHGGALLSALDSMHSGFKDRLQERWSEGLGWYRLALYLTHELGDDFNRSLRPIAARFRDHKFEALIRLHATGALICGEILELLRAGYASGAHARGRSLHETAVIAMFIQQENRETAERFLLHRLVKSYEDACEFQKHCERLGEEPLSQEELANIRRGYDAVVRRFGPDFTGSYGWAKSALASRNSRRKGSVRFSDLEEAISLDFWTPYYRMASHSVHSTASTVYYNIAFTPGRQFPLLAGPCNNGLADPGHGALLSMNNISAALAVEAANLLEFPQRECDTTVLLQSLHPCLRMQAIVKTLARIADLAGAAFLRAQKQLEAEELAKEEEPLLRRARHRPQTQRS